MSAKAKKILVVSSHAPYGKSTARESLDAVLAASAYEQDLQLLFVGDGVFQLLKQQDTSATGAKNLAATLPVLPLYDINDIYVHQQSLDQRQLTAADLVLEVKCLDSRQVAALMDRQEIILSF